MIGSHIHDVWHMVSRFQVCVCIFVVISNTGILQLVLWGPVQFGFLAKFGKTGTGTGPHISKPFKNRTGPRQTGLVWFSLVTRLVLTGFGLNQSETGLDRFLGQNLI